MLSCVLEEIGALPVRRPQESKKHVLGSIIPGLSEADRLHVARLPIRRNGPFH
jgi:hypothetical protein